MGGSRRQGRGTDGIAETLTRAVGGRVAGERGAGDGALTRASALRGEGEASTKN